MKGWDEDPFGAFVQKRWFGGYKVSYANLDYGYGSEHAWGGSVGSGVTDWVVVFVDNELSLHTLEDYIGVASDMGVGTIYMSTTIRTPIRDVTYTGDINYWDRFSIDTNFRVTTNPSTCTVLEGPGKCPN